MSGPPQLPQYWFPHLVPKKHGYTRRLCYKILPLFCFTWYALCPICHHCFFYVLGVCLCKSSGRPCAQLVNQPQHEAVVHVHVKIDARSSLRGKGFGPASVPDSDLCLDLILLASAPGSRLRLCLASPPRWRLVSASFLCLIRVYLPVPTFGFVPVPTLAPVPVPSFGFVPMPDFPPCLCA